MSDNPWERFARSDPYWAVITDEKYKGKPGPQERAAFFDSGSRHIEQIVGTVERVFGRTLGWNDRCLDFGCGVGRLLLPMAKICSHAVGIDVSTTMQELCQENAREYKLSNVECYSHTRENRIEDMTFDWINSHIVFQHIKTTEGYAIVDDLIKRVRANGVVSLHFTAFKDRSLNHYISDSYDHFTIDEGGPKKMFFHSQYYGENDMMMNDYDITRILSSLVMNGFENYYLEHENHGGMHGFVIYSIRGT